MAIPWWFAAAGIWRAQKPRKPGLWTYHTPRVRVSIPCCNWFPPAAYPLGDPTFTRHSLHAAGLLGCVRDGRAGVQGGRKPQSMSRLVAPAARPAVRTDWSRARGEQAQRYVAECHRPSVRGKHVHIARAEGTNGPCRLRLLQPDCWQTMSSHPAAGRGGRGSAARRRVCGWHVGSGHAGPVARTRLARRRPRSATGYSRDPACRSLS